MADYHLLHIPDVGGLEAELVLLVPLEVVLGGKGGLKSYSHGGDMR